MPQGVNLHPTFNSAYWDREFFFLVKVSSSCIFLDVVCSEDGSFLVNASNKLDLDKRQVIRNVIYQNLMIRSIAEPGT